MADQTHGAVDSLLRLLSNAIKDEAKLLSGVQGDIQFIKDEMDSMNGFLIHMTKTKMDHNDQHRAWMKQVREIAYIAEDCVALYMRDLSPPDRGLWALVRHFLWTMPKRHRLATKIRELKVRVREVGERRLRYGVTVPEDKDKQLKRSKPAGQDDKDIDKKRKDFLRALGPDDVQEITPPPPPPPHEPFNNAIELLLEHTASQHYDETTICSILKCMAVHTSKMFLCALHAYTYGTKEELKKLEEKLKDESADVHNEVMIFCYSNLSTHYKSCLQYLTAFHEETSISRTSLVRRWVAEGLVAREEGKTPEEAAERCFNELVFRGFVRPFETGDAGKVKSCRTRRDHNHSVRVLWHFIDEISESENFVDGLPIHLDRQLQIRKIVQQKLQQKPRGAGGRSFQTKPQDEFADDSSTTADSKDPLDEMVGHLKSLPEEYRLNVLDLGGCRGLKKHHLKIICKVRSIKYLSLRNTDVSRVPHQIQRLMLLETLDIRQTNVRAIEASSCRPPHIILPSLKHLLSGRRIDCRSDDTTTMSKESSLSTVRMPRKIGRNMEILSHVEVSRHGKVQLEEVGNLLKLRKLGVVLHGTGDNIKHLLRAIDRLRECLRSLSVWITPPLTADGGESLDNKAGDTPYSPPKNLESLNINGNLGNTVLPTWFQNLTNLSKVTLCETSLPDVSLRILGKLPGLLCLRLRRKSFTVSRLTFNSGEFEKLKFLLTEASTSASGVTFQDGAAPMLQKIVWWSLTGEDDIIRTDTISGIKHLRVLEEVELKGCHINCTPYPLEEDTAAHPKRPDLIYPFKLAQARSSSRGQTNDDAARN